ncbi:Carbohydrate-binding module family 13 protein [Ceratobasidium theobromae]|uniref:Carbohydrate-binding module family 13 protein n=1 Tax=Ceratobasidium theobromae TaxID=1582974 RepID=A0A5N5QGW3_9AGAM|nr:Carbohydrate-binding module family 13 protein [Ceratobasidium theobromae]
MLPFVVCTLAFAALSNAQYTATYDPMNLPDTTEKDQIGTNKCGTKSSQTSMWYVQRGNPFPARLTHTLVKTSLSTRSTANFCLWAPPYTDGKNSSVGAVEQIMVSWCMNEGYGTRLIPDGTIKGAHFVQTPDYVQVTGWGDFTKMNIPAKDSGGELDPHGADGLGNPHGGIVFGNSFGKWQQYHEWTNFMSATDFCIRACRDDGNDPKHHCNHIYDLQGCDWNMPANYSQGVFEDCKGDTGLPMGIYGSSTFQQGHGATPPAHPIPPSSSCSSYSTVKNGVVTLGAAAAATTTGTNSAGATVLPSATAGSNTSSSSNGGVFGLKSAMDSSLIAALCLVGAMLGGVMVL